jgi:hypothetical protein
MRKDTTPGALHENLLVHGAGAVDACWMLETPSSTAI